jgi:GNAT superfamily N-acetyltransferase
MSEPTEAYRLTACLPTTAEYCAICTAVGWQDVMNFGAAPAALRRSVYAVVVEHGGSAVGMGRLVGDGAIYFYVQDAAVLPEHQGRGIGRMVVDELVAWARRHAPDRAFLGLFAAAGTDPFYHRHGFERHDDLEGMYQVVLREP